MRILTRLSLKSSGMVFPGWWDCVVNIGHPWTWNHRRHGNHRKGSERSSQAAIDKLHKWDEFKTFNCAQKLTVTLWRGTGPQVIWPLFSEGAITLGGVIWINCIVLIFLLQRPQAHHNSQALEELKPWTTFTRAASRKNNSLILKKCPS